MEMMTWARITALVLGVAAASGTANAQSACKYITTNAVLTASQWNYCFQQKTDNLGFSPLNAAGGVMTGKLVTTPSTSSSSGFSLPPGTTPLTPKDGDIWTTTSGLYAQINGTTVGPIGQSSIGANLFYAGPTSGPASAPSFRSIVSSDLPLATGSSFGAVKPDGSTISISGGILSAIGASATTIQSGVTNFTSATNGNCGYNNSGKLGDKPCITRVNIVPFQTAGSFTYTPTAGMVYAKVECVGGGGGGGGANGASGNSAGGGGGGSGAYSQLITDAATIGASKPVTVGAGGTGTTGPGGTGGDTSLSTLCVAKGGLGGGQATSGGANGGAGGAASGGTGTAKFSGNGGSPGFGVVSFSTALGGTGAGSYFGGGAKATTNTGAGLSGTGCGGAGSGGAVYGATSVNGGAGAAGCVIITEFINQ